MKPSVDSPSTKVQFYRRTLPLTCIAFGSDEGKSVFKESLLSGFANIYFPLAEQFRTQAEPAYCGLSTLVMILNTLSVCIYFFCFLIIIGSLQGKSPSQNAFKFKYFLSIIEKMNPENFRQIALTVCMQSYVRSKFYRNAQF